jgi:hypothetical protein
MTTFRFYSPRAILAWHRRSIKNILLNMNSPNDSITKLTKIRFLQLIHGFLSELSFLAGMSLRNQDKIIATCLCLYIKYMNPIFSCNMIYISLISSQTVAKFFVGIKEQTGIGLPTLVFRSDTFKFYISKVQGT